MNDAMWDRWILQRQLAQLPQQAPSVTPVAPPAPAPVRAVRPPVRQRPVARTKAAPQPGPNFPGPISPEERAGILSMFAGGPGDQAAPPVASPDEKAGILAMFADGPGAGDAPAAGPQAQAPQADPGFLDKIRGALSSVNDRGDRNAIYDGLIQAGIGLMSGRDFREGMAQGFQGFQKGYQGRIDQDKAENTPKVVPLAGGAFSLMVYPDGRQRVLKNDEVAQYMADTQDSKLAQALAKIGYQGQVTQSNQQAQQDNKDASEARQQLLSTQNTLGQMQKALDIVSNQGASAKLQGLPGVSALADFIGTDDAAANKFLAGIKVDESLLKTAQTKGAISDAEMKLFQSPIPSLYADREKVWKPYLEQRIPIIQRVAAALQQTIDRGSAPPGVPAPGGGVAPAPAAPVDRAYIVPGLSAKASKYFN